MNDNEVLKERFKSAVSSATKAISENFNLEVKFGSNLPSKKDSLNLPDVINLRKLQDFVNLRAFADSEALKIRYNDNKIYLENEPKGSLAKALYSVAEKIRYEKIGSDKLKGVRNNIVQCYESKFKNKKIDEIKTESDVSVTEAFELYLRSHFFNIKQNDTTKKILSYWKDSFDKNVKKKFNDLDKSIENQSKYSQIMTELINSLDFEDSESNEKDEKKEDKADNSASNESKENEDNSPDYDENQENSAESNVIDSNPETLNDNKNLDENDAREVAGSPSSFERNKKNLLKDKYKIFTSEYDEINEAKELENESEILRLRKNLDQQLTSLQNVVAKLAATFEHQRMAVRNK